MGASPTGPLLRWSGLPVCHGSGAGWGPRGHSRSEQPELRFANNVPSSLMAPGSSLLRCLCGGSDLRPRKAHRSSRCRE